MMLKLLIATSWVMAMCQGQFQMPQMGMARPMGRPRPAAPPRRTPGMFHFGPFAMNFNLYTAPTANLQQICNDAMLKNNGRAGDYLSDVMSTGVKYMMNHRPGSKLNPLTMVNGPKQQNWECLLSGATKGFRNMGNIANGVSDYFDTVVEHPVRRMIEGMGMHFNPCDTVFCGEAGMTPLAVMNAVLNKMNYGQSLGAIGSAIFGQSLSNVNKKIADRFALNPRNPLGMSRNPMFQMGTAFNPMGQMGTASNAMGQMGTASNAMGQISTALNAMGQTGTASNPMGQISTALNAMGQTGTASNAMGQPGTASNAMGQPGTAAASGGLNPLSQMMSAFGQVAAAGNPMTSIWQNMAGSGSNTAATAPGTGSASAWQQPAPSGNPMMDMWRQMAPSPTGTGSNAAGAGAGTGNMWQQLLGGGRPAAPSTFNGGAPGVPGMNSLNNIMGMMFAHQAMQDAPDLPAYRSPAMMGSGRGGMGLPAAMPNFGMFGMPGAPQYPAPQQTQMSTGMGNTGGMGMSDIMRLLG